jgi:hypothetical protein
MNKLLKEFQATKVRTANIISVLVVFFCFGLLWSLMMVEIPESNRDVFNFLSGIVVSQLIRGVNSNMFNYKKSDEEAVKNE